jgi:transposase
MLKAMAEDTPLHELKWGAGRPPNSSYCTEEQEAWIVNRDTLRRQVGMSLQQRVNKANFKFNLSLTKYRIRLIYRRTGITLQKCRSQMKPPNHFGVVEQQQQLD